VIVTSIHSFQDFSEVPGDVLAAEFYDQPHCFGPCPADRPGITHRGSQISRCGISCTGKASRWPAAPWERLMKADGLRGRGPGAKIRTTRPGRNGGPPGGSSWS